jgi:hypothetical protein
MIARDRSHELAFCGLDDATTLVMEYTRSTREIMAMSLVVVPEAEPKSKRCQYQLGVLELRFEERGIYWLKVQRAAKNGEMRTYRGR